MRLRDLAVSGACFVVGCGGALQPDTSSSDGGASSTFSASLPPDTPYGAWDLVSLDGMPGGNGSTQTLGQLALDIRSDGVVIAQHCTRASFDADLGGFVCAEPSAYECLYGNVLKDGGTWFVDIPDLHAPVLAGRGLTLLEARDALVIRYVLPKYAAGHFVRVAGRRAAMACRDP